jgi:hypothetical protein
MVYHMFKSRMVSRIVKVKLYKTMLKPIVKYGRETWSITEMERVMLNM